MLASESSPFASLPLPDVVATDVDTESPLTRDWQAAARDKWQQVIDYRLIEWGRDPSALEDVGVEPPSVEIIQRAIRLAQACQEHGEPPPDSVVLDPNGGIVFERREGDVSEVFHLWDDGTAEYRHYRGTHLVERQSL